MIWPNTGVVLAIEDAAHTVTLGFQCMVCGAVAMYENGKPPDDKINEQCAGRQPSSQGKK